MAESRAEQIARWERDGLLDPKCIDCRAFYAYDRMPCEVNEPRHVPSVNCQGNRRPHCVCDRCW